MKNLVADKPDGIIVHARANDIAKGINYLNSVKTIVKNIKKISATTKLVFSPIYYQE